MMIAIGIILWVFCWALATGAANQYMRHEFSFIRYDDKEGWKNIWQCTLIGMGGPCSLIVLFFGTDFFYHGFSFRWRAEKNE